MTQEDRIKAATAIAQAGSPAYSNHAGATLTFLSDLALRGELETLSRTLIAHIGVHPPDRRKLVSAVPAIILNQYLCGCRKRAFSDIQSWRERTPDWAATLKRALGEPEHFAAVAAMMGDEIDRSALD